MELEYTSNLKFDALWHAGASPVAATKPQKESKMSDKSVKTGFMCSTDFEEHIEHDPDGTTIYRSEASLRDHKGCVSGDAEELPCGIYEVEVRIKRVVTESKVLEFQQTKPIMGVDVE